MTQSIFTIGRIAWGAGPTIIRDIRSGSDRPNAQKVFLGGSGGIERTFAAMMDLRPQLDFTTGDIRNALNTFDGANPTPFSASEFVAYLKYVDPATALVASTASHIQRTVAKGLLVPTQLTIPGGGASATLSYLLHMISTDGATSPYSQQTAALPAGSDQAAEGFTLGGVALNGAALEGVDNVTVNFGWSPWILAGDGHLYPTFGGGGKRAIVIAITARDAEAFMNWGVAGQAQGATDSVITIDDVTENTGIRGASPITLTIDDGLMHSDGLTWSDGSPCENTILLEVTWDGTADPIVFTGLT